MAIQIQSQIQKRLFKVGEYHRMAEAGILTEDDRVELIRGEIVQVSPIGSRHAACVDRFTQNLVPQVIGRAIVRVQSPIQVSEDSEPQPDLVLLKLQPDFYATRHPQPDDVLLVVEVADTTAEFDRNVKIPLYGQAGIPESLLVDLGTELIEDYQDPSPHGYRTVRIFRPGESITLSTLPNVTLAVDDIL